MARSVPERRTNDHFARRENTDDDSALCCRRQRPSGVLCQQIAPAYPSTTITAEETDRDSTTQTRLSSTPAVTGRRPATLISDSAPNRRSG